MVTTHLISRKRSEEREKIIDAYNSFGCFGKLLIFLGNCMLFRACLIFPLAYTFYFHENNLYTYLENALHVS